MNCFLTTSLLSESLPLFPNLHIFVTIIKAPVVGSCWQCTVQCSSHGGFSSCLSSQAREVLQSGKQLVVLLLAKATTANACNTANACMESELVEKAR